MLAWIRKRLAWRREHQRAWAGAQKPDSTGVSPLQRDCLDALAAVYKRANRTAPEAQRVDGNELYFTGVLLDGRKFYIYLDGAEGGTGAGPHIATEETGIPLMAAIPEARRALEDVGLADEIDLVVAGGIRNGGDVAKALSLGAKAVALGHAALMALNCNKEIPGVTDYEGTIGVPAGQCYHCHTGRCPVGITTQDPELRKRLVVDDAAERVYNFLHTLTLEVQMLARACGKTNVHSLEPEDLCALTVEAAAMAKVPLAGTNYVPGLTEENALAEIKRLLEKHIEYPVDYLPDQPAEYAGAED